MSQTFFDDFDGKKLNRSKWKKADRKWGDEYGNLKHGGVVPKNAFIENGNLVLRANGDFYSGKISGHGQNHRVGAAIHTRKVFGSARYEIRAKVCPQLGALSALWTFRHDNNSINHEIDFEIPGKSPQGRSLQWGILTNWTGLSDKEHRSLSKYIGDQADGNYHLYRFDWHIGTDSQPPKIDWYYDNRLIHSSYEVIPFKPSRFWIGVWFPWWLGQSQFDSDFMYVDWVKITPL
jgi:beta-glucanase (GH16 family)